MGPRPRLGNYTLWLDELRTNAINRVVSLLSSEDIENYSLQGEGRALDDYGINFQNFPIDDFGVPEKSAFADLMQQLRAHLENGEHIFLHCAGGVGRAGTTAACLLIEQGLEADKAMARVSEARGITCPETEEQVSFVRQWATDRA